MNPNIARALLKKAAMRFDWLIENGACKGCLDVQRQIEDFLKEEQSTEENSSLDDVQKMADFILNFKKMSPSEAMHKLDEVTPIAQKWVRDWWLNG